MIAEKPDADAELASKQAAARLIAQPTVGQMEREVSQKIQALYKKVLGHQLGRVTCQLFDARIVIILEDSISQPVRLLLEESQTELAQQIRSDLNNAMQPHIQDLLADVLGVDVLDMISDATLSAGRTGITGVLARLPAGRNPETIPEARKFT